MPTYDKEDPITGYIAFERVLDRLLEEAREGHAMRERLCDLESEHRAMAQRLPRLESETKAARAAVEPIRQLYEAAVVLAAAASAVKRPPAGLALAVLKLQEALKGAVPHVDLIPF